MASYHRTSSTLTAEGHFTNKQLSNSDNVSRNTLTEDQGHNENDRLIYYPSNKSSYSLMLAKMHPEMNKIIH